jgi:hypothetical protein
LERQSVKAEKAAKKERDSVKVVCQWISPTKMNRNSKSHCLSCIILDSRVFRLSRKAIKIRRRFTPRIRFDRRIKHSICSGKFQAII